MTRRAPMAVRGAMGRAPSACMRLATALAVLALIVVAIAVALLREVPVLLLDEPTSGLDPSATADFNAILSQVRERGTAVLMVTHDLLSAADVADRIVFLEGGRVTDDVAARGPERFDVRALHARFQSAPGTVAV